MKTNLLIGTLCTSLAILDLSNYMSRLNEVEVGALRGVATALELESYNYESNHDYKKKKLIELSKDYLHYSKTRDRGYLNIADTKLVAKGDYVLPWVMNAKEHRERAELPYEIEPIWDSFDTDRKNIEMKVMASRLSSFAMDKAADPKDLWQGLVFAGFGIYGFWCAFRDKYLIKQEVTGK